MDSPVIIAILLTLINPTSSSQGNFPGSRPCGIPKFKTADVVDDVPPDPITGHRIKLRCKHEFYEANATSDCLNGVWSHPNPPCRYVQCPYLGNLVNGGYEIGPERRVGVKVTLECREGYWLRGSNTRVCQRNGQWSGTKTRCIEVTCSKLKTPDHGSFTRQPPYKFNDEVGLNCYNGYVYDGKRIKCHSNGTWTEDGNVGNCIEISEIRCSSTKADNIRVDPDKTSYVYNETINISCEEGFAYSGTTNRTCGVKTWSGIDGTCYRIYCEKPTFPIRKGKFEACNFCPYGTKLNITCEEGYVHQNNSNPVCINDGAIGKWRIFDKICEAVKCEGNPIIENGFIEGNKSGVFKDERTVKCNEGFQYQGPGNIRCQDDGQWSYPGICNIRASNTRRIIISVLGIVVVILLGVSLYIINVSPKKNGTTRLKDSICKGGHFVENALDKRIDLETGFIPLRVVDENKKVLKKADEGVMMDKYLSYLKRYEGLQEINMDDLIAELEGGELMVIQGRAGVGKTTLIQKLAWKWAKGNWAQNYKALLVYNMRYISPKDKRIMTLAKFLEDYLFHRPGSLKSFITKGVEAQGEGWIIFLDAIDEFPNLLQRLEKGDETNYSERSCPELPAFKWCMLLWRRQALPKAVITLTSRHIKELKILNPKKNIEVLGLTQDSIMSMVDSQIEDTNKAEALKNVLRNNPILMSASSITFLCQMLCNAFKKSQNFAEETEGLTTYTRIMIFIIQNFIRRNQKDDSEGDPLNQTEILKLQPFTKLAYLGLCENQDNIDLAQLIFDEEDIENAGITDTDLRSAQELGFIIHSERVPFQPGKGDGIIEFLHLSIQELLAMTYLLNQAPKGAVDVFNSMWDTKRFHMAQLYLFGLCFDEGMSDADLFMPECAREEIKHGLSQALTDNAAKDSNDRHQVLRAIQAAHETGNAEVTKQVALSLFKDNKFALRDTQLTAVDLLSIIDMIDSHGEVTEIRLDRVSTDESSMSVLSTFLAKNNSITTLSLHGVSLKGDSFNSLIDSVSRNQKMKHLFLENTDINDQMMPKLKVLLEANKCLEEVSIANNDITDVGILTMAEALTKNETLQKLIVDTGNMDVKYIGALTYLTVGNKKVKIVLRGSKLEPKLELYIKGIPGLQTRICFETQSEDKQTAVSDMKTTCL